MTITEPTTTDLSVLGVTILAGLIARCRQSAAELRAITSEVTPILERAQQVYAEAEAIEQEAYTVAKLATDDGDALDGVGQLVAGLTGAREMNQLLNDLAVLADPDGPRSAID